MAQSFQFDLVSPERLLVSQEVDAVIVPGSEGEMTVMANHAPVMSTVRPGVVTVRPVSGGEQRYVVFGGFLDILPDRCTLLAESSVPIADMDKAELTRRIEAARQDVEQAKDDAARTKAETYLAQLTTLEGGLPLPV